VCDRIERVAFGRAIVADHLWKCASPRPTPCGEGGFINFKKAAVNPAFPLGHRPVCKALVEISGEKSNERRMDPRIGVDTVHRDEPIAVAHRQDCPSNRWRRVRTRHCIEACRPQPTHRQAFVVDAIAHLP
jgi:hypothetical protein